MILQFQKWTQCKCFCQFMNLKWWRVLSRKIQSMRLARGCKHSELLNNSTLMRAALKIQDTAREFSTKRIFSIQQHPTDNSCSARISYNQLSLAIISYLTLSLSESVWHCSRLLLLGSLWLGQAFQAWDYGPQVFKSASRWFSQKMSRRHYTWLFA